MGSEYRKGRLSQARANPLNKEEKRYLITDPVFLIGNGTSRRDFDLERLRGKGTIVGCNALYRDFSPDILVSIDAKMLKELHESKYCNEHECIVPHNRTVQVPNAMRWRADKYNTSGCFAIKMITELMAPKYCFMLGMDGYPGNVYDGTVNYAANTLQNFSGINRYYLEALQIPGRTIFVNVNTEDKWSPECHKTGRYAFMEYCQFEKFLEQI